jgi:N-acetylglucosaminyl-diphospho-decaprenol L-rhamnosyltransferase
MKQTTVVIVSYNSRQDLPASLESVQKSRVDATIVVVDNDSSDGSADYVAKHWPEVTLVRSRKNLGYAAACNLGARTVPGQTILFMNPDVQLGPACLERLVEALAGRPGACGPVIRVERGSAAGEYGSVVDLMLMPLSLLGPGRPLFVSGACLATNRDAFETVHGFDERFFLFNEDIEYCWQLLRCGFDVYTVDDVHCIHKGGASIAGGYYREGRIETSGLRLVERERGATAVAAACVPIQWLPFFVLFGILRTNVIAFGLLGMGNPRLAWNVLATVGWNAREIGRSIRRRRNPAASLAGSKEAFRRVRRSFTIIRTLCQFGLPRIVG